jgi:hypothetical protein
VLALLRATARDALVTPTTQPGETWTEREEERAAVAEFDGGTPRAWAEGLARLDPSKPPGDVPLRRWLHFIDDCGRFLDGGWVSRAAELGWGPLDLFGCDRERPFGRIEHAGLLWLLKGRKLIALAADMAVIETPTGGRQTYHRRLVDVGRVVLAWEVITPTPREVEAERWHHPVRVIGDCPPETVCLRCHQVGDVKRVVDASAPVSKSETLHVSCAEAWFAKLASTTIEPDVPIDDAAGAVPHSGNGRRCRYCGRGELATYPLLTASTDGEVFLAHRSCLDIEFASWSASGSEAGS